MALAGLLGAGARAASGQLVKSAGKKIVASKVLNKKSKQRKNIENEKNSEIVGRSSAITYQKNRINFKDFLVDVEETAPKTVKKTGGIGSQLRIIRTEVYSIEKILKKNLKKDEKYADRKRVLLEKRGRKDKETSREKPKSGKKGLALAKKLVPGNFLDAIQKFIGNILLGKFVLFLIESFDKIAEFLKFIAPATDFLTNTIGALFNGIVSVVEGAYSANEAIRKEIEAVGGEDALKEYDKFTDAFKKFANIAIILALTGIPGSIGPKGAKGLKGPFSKSGPAGAFSKSGKGLGGTSAIRQYTGRSGAAKLIERKLGNPAAKIYENAIKNGKTPAQAKAAVDKAIKSGKITPKAAGPGLGKGTGAAKGGIFKRGIGQSVSRAQTKIMGRGARLGINRVGTRVASKIAKFGGGRIPILGPLIVGISTFMETGKLDKALFLAGGSALGGFLGSFIPIPILGTILGTLLGEYVGDLFYVLLKDGGIKGLGQKLKRDIQKIIDMGTLVKDWILKGINNIQQQEGGLLGNIPIGIPFTNMNFKLGGWAEILNPIGDPFKKLKILKDSFFSESIATKTPAPVTTENGENQWWDFLNVIPNSSNTEENGENQWWDFLNIIPNSSGSNNRGASPVTPTGSVSATPKGNETGILSLSGGTPKALAQGSTISNTQLHHGDEDTRGELKVRDYFIGGAVGPSNGVDGLGAKIYTPLGFGPVKYKKLDKHGITFHDPKTDEKVGMYYHVNDAQHQLDGQIVQPGTLVGTQGGLPGTSSAYPYSTSVHLHVEGTDKFHNAVISTYAGGHVLNDPDVITQQNPQQIPQQTSQQTSQQTPKPKAQAGLTQQELENINQAKNAIEKINSVGTDEGTGDKIRIPDVGTFVSGREGFWQLNKDKYFDQSGNRITNEEFDEILKSRYGITLSKPKLEPQLSPTPPKPLTNLETSASYEDSDPDVMVAIQPIIINSENSDPLSFQTSPSYG